MKRQFRAKAALVAPMVGCGILVSGCMNAPTYGTDRTSTAQLGSDLSSVFSLRPRVKTVGEYKPRPELVKPASLAELPAPQDSIATADNPQWPESPEKKRARLRAEATANQDDNLYEPMIVDDTLPKQEKVSGLTPEQKNDRDAAPMSNVESRKVSERAKAVRAESMSSPTKRKYLSDPPLTYREAAASAPTGDLGEDELKKQRRIKRQATKGGGGWRDWIPGF